MKLDSAITDYQTTLNTLAIQYNIQEGLRIENYIKISEQLSTIGTYASENDSLKEEIFVLQQNCKRVERNFKRVKIFGVFGLLKQK